MMILDICPSPALYPFYRQEHDTLIVVDIFRASTTMCAMLHHGAAAIIPVADIDQARAYKEKGFLVGAERHTRKCDFADCGNSPFDYTPERVHGREVVFTTTNGTRAIEQGKDTRELLIGSFSNIGALTRHCLHTTNRIVILCAGWHNRINLEDTLFGGAFAELLSAQSDVTIGSDAVRIAQLLWQRAKADPPVFLKASDHYARLLANGAEGDAAYCLSPDTVSVVPVYHRADKKIRAFR
ncbi:MAG: 2-phosphosulfolactate phosphatase [Proteiniphilum sp.]|nr:2-phosphosulfolactate phosphatase [Proteiniphilum sp.]MDD4158216.1 2-phosphosulfolactate phosphatase [Proteiniphilum sp.]MDD4799530.1 2-phosphosulfolactate phosphatase [Proteiniphilum sp.]